MAEICMQSGALLEVCLSLETVLLCVEVGTSFQLVSISARLPKQIIKAAEKFLVFEAFFLVCYALILPSTSYRANRLVAFSY